MTSISDDQVKVWVRFTLLLLCVQAVLMIGLMVTFIVTQSRTSADQRYLRMTDSLLDVQARMDRTEQNEIVLFRMLRNENDQRGVIPDWLPLPPSPHPKPAPNRTGSALPGDAFGDAPGDPAFGDTN